ncbi:hypothetical protein LOH54_04930 [Sulfurimonas sp. HSL-3221]|uniref:hypothetical protein n=1 Tax=Sulfurimonadaceae TaxID=2771471 RepID=UPI001E34FF41|nr:hypothetical protein [Sulfurimonas sp. HSL-3221]UFS63476.1 hypothetical protein LOH54_04930 [Sulfurimonas sp. HSL-3221]
MREYAISFFSWIWSGILWCWNALNATYALPGWIWLLIFIFAFIGLINIFLAFKGEATIPEYKSYTEDSIYGLVWRWDWVGNQISNLWCYCPNCDATLVYNEPTRRRSLFETNQTNFICENCGHKIVGTIQGGNKNYAIGAVEREIDRRIRNNEFQKH